MTGDQDSFTRSFAVPSARGTKKWRESDVCSSQSRRALQPREAGFRGGAKVAGDCMSRGPPSFRPVSQEWRERRSLDLIQRSDPTVNSWRLRMILALHDIHVDMPLQYKYLFMFYPVKHFIKIKQY